MGNSTSCCWLGHRRQQLTTLFCFFVSCIIFWPYSMNKAISSYIFCTRYIWWLIFWQTRPKKNPTEWLDWNIFFYYGKSTNPPLTDAHDPPPRNSRPYFSGLMNHWFPILRPTITPLFLRIGGPTINLHSCQLNIAIKYGPFEEVFPIEDGDIPASYYPYQTCTVYIYIYTYIWLISMVFM